MPRSVGAAAAPARQRYRGRDIDVGDADLSAFQAIHAAVQEAWSRGDLGRLRPLMTPEMLSYFSRGADPQHQPGRAEHRLQRQAAQGRAHRELGRGRPANTPPPICGGARIDYVVRLGARRRPDALVSGDPRSPIEAEEVWTFVRRRGGNWLLSAIQQV